MRSRKPRRARSGGIGQVGGQAGGAVGLGGARAAVAAAEEQGRDDRGHEDHDQHARVLHEGHEPGVGVQLVGHAHDARSAAGHEPEQRRRSVQPGGGGDGQASQQRHADRSGDDHGHSDPAPAEGGEGAQVERRAHRHADEGLGHGGDALVRGERDAARERVGKPDQQRGEQRRGGQPERTDHDGGGGRGQSEREPAHPPHDVRPRISHITPRDRPTLDRPRGAPNQP
jgi:hypothetical protein